MQYLQFVPWGDVLIFSTMFFAVLLFATLYGKELCAKFTVAAVFTFLLLSWLKSVGWDAGIIPFNLSDFLKQMIYSATTFVVVFFALRKLNFKTNAYALWRAVPVSLAFSLFLLAALILPTLEHFGIFSASALFTDIFAEHTWRAAWLALAFLSLFLV